MQTQQIVALLIAERDRLSNAIEALQGPARRGRPPASASRNTAPAAPTSAPVRKKRRISAAGRRAIAEAAKRRWAAIKASKSITAAKKGVGAKAA